MRNFQTATLFSSVLELTKSTGWILMILIKPRLGYQTSIKLTSFDKKHTTSNRIHQFCAIFELQYPWKTSYEWADFVSLHKLYKTQHLVSAAIIKHFPFLSYLTLKFFLPVNLRELQLLYLRQDCNNKSNR